MNFSPLPVIMFMAGVVLLYAAIKDVDPRDVVKNALQGKATAAGNVRMAGRVDAPPPPSGFQPGAGAGKGGGGGGTGSW